MRKRRRVTHPTGSPFASPKAKVQTQFRRDTDINQIVERARRGIAPTNTRVPSYADFSDAPESLTEAFQRVERAWDAFEALPAKARLELNNDPRQLFRCDDEFFRRHGLVMEQDPDSDPAPSPAEPSSPPPASKAKQKAKQPEAPAENDA